MCVHVLDRPPERAADVRGRPPVADWFHLAALLEGVYVLRGAHLYLSTPLDEHDLAFVRDALARALARLAGLEPALRARAAG
jgi:hypothetical protein